MQIVSASSLSPTATQNPTWRAEENHCGLGVPTRQTVPDLVAGHHDLKVGALITVKVGIMIPLE
ncbi:MAG TPA: hypothetical protein VMM15_02820 [Bradyrhizobium sp.]|nr:hypothetical protein [Bradyrhizobium sp.]